MTPFVLFALSIALIGVSCYLLGREAGYRSWLPSTGKPSEPEQPTYEILGPLGPVLVDPADISVVIETRA